MDGVIVDSEVHWKDPQARFIQTLVGELTIEDERRFIGMSIPDIYNILYDKYKLNLSLKQFMEEYDKIAYIIYNKKVSMVPKCLELIKTLKSKNFQLGLASSSPKNWIDIVLKRFELAVYFDVITSGDEVKKSKPHPEIFLKTADKMKMNPEKCVVIEDSRNGVIAAISSGMKVIGLKTKEYDQDLSYANIVIDNLEKISLDKIKGL